MYGTELVIFNSTHNTERLIVSIMHHYADSVIAKFAIPTLYSKNLKMFLARYRLIFLRTNATRVHKSNFVLSVRFSICPLNHSSSETGMYMEEKGTGGIGGLWSETEVSFREWERATSSYYTFFSWRKPTGERTSSPSSFIPSPFLFHSFEISFQVKVFPLLSVETLNRKWVAVSTLLMVLPCYVYCKLSIQIFKFRLRPYEIYPINLHAIILKSLYTTKLKRSKRNIF